MRIKQKRILYEIHHGIGDVIQSLSTLRNIKKCYPNSILGVIVGSKACKEIVKLCDYVDDIYVFSLKSMKLPDVLRFIYENRKKHWDIGIVSPITNQIIGPLFIKLLGCHEVVYMAQKGNFFIRGGIHVPLFNGHKIEQCLKLLEAINIPIIDKIPFLPINSQMIQFIEKMCMAFHKEKKTIGICVGTNPVIEKRNGKEIIHDIKKWELQKYLELISMLENDFNILLLVGAKEEEEIMDKFPHLLEQPNCYIGKTTIHETIALISQCDAVIGGDTGMIHIADALGVKTFVIYGPTDPAKVGPISGNSTPISLGLRCQYCYDEPNNLYKCTDNVCIKHINVARVYDTVYMIMKG